ncbi:MAG: hypothetical protein WCK29_02810 [archaeon]
MSTSYEFRKMECIVLQLTQITQSSGLDLRTIAEKCAHKWSTSNSNARLYIRDNFLGKLGLTKAEENHRNCRDTLVRRLDDYLVITHASEADRVELYEKLSGLFGDIKPLKYVQSLDSMEGLGDFAW